jgi:hypothetical protein
MLVERGMDVTAQNKYRAGMSPLCSAAGESICIFLGRGLVTYGDMTIRKYFF